MRRVKGIRNNCKWEYTYYYESVRRIFQASNKNDAGCVISKRYGRFVSYRFDEYDNGKEKGRRNARRVYIVPLLRTSISHFRPTQRWKTENERERRKKKKERGRKK